MIYLHYTEQQTVKEKLYKLSTLSKHINVIFLNAKTFCNSKRLTNLKVYIDSLLNQEEHYFLLVEKPDDFEKFINGGYSKAIEARCLIFDDFEHIFNHFENMFETNFNKSLFQKDKLTDFEEVLFLRSHVKSLQNIIRLKNIQFGNLKTDFDRQVFFNLDCVKLNNQKEIIKSLRKKLNQFLNKEEIEETIKESVNFKAKSNAENLTRWQQKAEKYKQLYFDVLNQIRND